MTKNSIGELVRAIRHATDGPNALRRAVSWTSL
jgi:hypothetical protein